MESVQEKALPVSNAGLISTHLDSFEIKSIPGKGQGMFAARMIPAGSVIYRERPLIVMPDEVFSLEDMDRIERWLDRKIINMSSQERAAFYGLSDCRTPEDPTALGIFFTNDMNFKGDAALFPVLARVNHACKPNADFVTRSALHTQDLVALRDIGAGEEITFCYLSSSAEGMANREQRQHYLMKWYGFRCTCPTCTAEGASLNANEILRGQLSSIQKRGLESCSVQELESVLCSAWKVGLKPSFRLDVAEILREKAIQQGDLLMAARGAIEGYEMEALVGLEDSPANPWKAALDMEIVIIGGKGFAFPK